MRAPGEEDTTAQVERLHVARAHLATALDDFARVATTTPDGAGAAVEAREVARALRSRAKRPPTVDLGPLWGAVSATERVTTTGPAWDDAARALRDAERAADLAAHDLATARGEDA